MKFVSPIFMVMVAAFLTCGAHAQMPNCLANGSPIQVNNDQVLQWKSSTPNQYTARGHIKGTLVQVYRTSNYSHDHMEVQIGPNSTDTIEVIYNEHFGQLPRMAPGDTIEACGDYKTSNRRSGHYPPSPDGAIVHWVHLSTKNSHPSGYVAVNGQAYGTQNPGN